MPTRRHMTSTETASFSLASFFAARAWLRGLQGSEPDVRVRRLLGRGEGCVTRRNGIGGCFGRDRRGRWWSRGRRGRRRGWCGRRLPEWRRRCRGGRSGCGSVRERWCGRIGRGGRCVVIRYTRHTVFLVRPGAVRRRPRADATAAGRRPRRRRRARAATPDSAGPAAAPAAPAPAAACRAPTRQTRRGSTRSSRPRASRLRKHELLEEEAAKRAKEAPKVTIDDKGFALALPGQVVRAEDPRPGAGRRALLLDDQNAAGERHLPHPPLPPVARRDAVLARRLPPGARVRRDGADPRRATSTCIPWEWLRAARRQDEGPGRPRTPAERRRPRAARARARSEPVQPARRRRGQLWGDIAGGICPVHAGVFNGAPDNAPPTSTSTTPRTSPGGCSSALPDRGAARLRQPGRRRWRRRPATARAALPTSAVRRGPDRPRAVPDRRSEHVLPVPGARDRHDRRADHVHARAGDAPQPAALLLLRLVRPARRVRVAEAGRAEGEQHDASSRSRRRTRPSATPSAGTEDYDGATPEHALRSRQRTPGRAAARGPRSELARASTTRRSRPTRTRSPARARRRGSRAAATWVLRRSVRFAAALRADLVRGRRGDGRDRHDTPAAIGEPADRVPAASGARR